MDSTSIRTSSWPTVGEDLRRAAGWGNASMRRGIQHAPPRCMGVIARSHCLAALLGSGFVNYELEFRQLHSNLS